MISDDLDFELGPAPYYYLRLKYPIHSVHPTQCLTIDPTTKQLEFNINTDYFDFETNSRRTLNQNLMLMGLMMRVLYLLIFQQEN